MAADSVMIELCDGDLTGSLATLIAKDYDPIIKVRKAEPRDGDKDGWVYDGTPQMRPAAPRIIHDLRAMYGQGHGSINAWIERDGLQLNMVPQRNRDTLRMDGPPIDFPNFNQEDVDKWSVLLREIAESADVHGITITSFKPSDDKMKDLFRQLGFVDDHDYMWERFPRPVGPAAKWGDEVPLFDKGKAGGYLAGPKLRALLEEFRDSRLGVYQPQEGDTPLHGGVSAQFVVRVRFKDSTGKERDLVIKDVRTSNYAYNEDWAGSIANALGLPFDAVKLDESTVVMPWIDGDTGYSRPIDWDHPPTGALEMALLDTLIVNEDRNSGNYLIDDENQVFPIDHSYGMYSGLTDANDGGTIIRWASHSSPFVTEMLMNRPVDMGKVRYLQGKIDAMTDDDMPVDVRETMRKRMRNIIKQLEEWS